jgi:hypothetical protein
VQWDGAICSLHRKNILIANRCSSVSNLHISLDGCTLLKRENQLHLSVQRNHLTTSLVLVLALFDPVRVVYWRGDGLIQSSYRHLGENSDIAIRI